MAITWKVETLGQLRQLVNESLREVDDKTAIFGLGVWLDDEQTTVPNEIATVTLHPDNHRSFLEIEF